MGVGRAFLPVENTDGQECPSYLLKLSHELPSVASCSSRPRSTITPGSSSTSAHGGVEVHDTGPQRVLASDDCVGYKRRTALFQPIPERPTPPDPLREGTRWLSACPEPSLVPGPVSLDGREDPRAVRRSGRPVGARLFETPRRKGRGGPHPGCGCAEALVEGLRCSFGFLVS